MMFSKSVAALVLGIVAVSEASSLERRSSDLCDGSPGEIERRDELTKVRALTLCPGLFFGQQGNHIRYAFVNEDTGEGGHCGGNEAKTAWLQASVANGLFGGHDDPPVDTASLVGRDCSAHCVLNSEGKGHFKFKKNGNNKGNCYEYRGTGMCGNDQDKEYATDRKARLCTRDDCSGKCWLFSSGFCRKPKFGSFYKCNNGNSGVCGAGYTDCRPS
eukprot:m.148506 g.148506  ORF g.148506 m.148506 type:complete len:216 (-) comp30601_c0_seq1:378-1025(-)